jgi:hypothetical protein
MQTTSVRRVMVESGGDQIVSYVGLHALGSLADQLGLGDALSARIPPRSARLPLHDRGKVLVQAMLMLAGGGECCSDIEYLRAEDGLFADVCSDSTLYRTFSEDLTPETLASVKDGFGEVRAKAWKKLKLTKGTDPVVLDIDATLTDVHSEQKEGTGPNYKGGYGFHPMGCFCDATGETLAMKLRPGNAGANDAEDHLVVLDEAIAQLPAEIAVGHKEDDEETEVRRRIVVRTDSAGATKDFVWGCFDRNVGFSVSARTNAQVQGAILAIAGEGRHWRRARRQDGRRKERAAVCEVSDLVDLSGWPPGTRLVIRREPLHQGAQQSLFPDLCYRYVGFYSDQRATAVALDVFHRAHAHVEDHIERLKDSGLCRLPFTDLEANRAWLAEVCMAADLVRWFQLLCLSGALRGAEPKALRWRLWHAPARIVRSGRQQIMRILDGWPDADVLLRSYERVALLS